MKRIIIPFLSAIIFCSCQSITGSGNIKEETRNVDKFDGIKSSGSMDFEVMDDDQQSVKIEADDNILPYIITTVDDGMLTVKYKSGMSFSNTHIKIYVAAPVLKKISISGSGDIIAKTPLKADNIELNISGAGDMNAEIDAPAVKADISGSGTITLQGKTKDFNCRVSGAGDIKCKNLLSENTSVTLSGTGSAHVYASVHLVARVSGVGDIYYSGNPPSPETHSSGVGSIQPEK